MIYDNTTDVYEGVNVDKTNESKECAIFHCWYFLDIGFRFQTYVSYGCHDLLMMLLF